MPRYGRCEFVFANSAGGKAGKNIIHEKVHVKKIQLRHVILEVKFKIRLFYGEPLIFDFSDCLCSEFRVKKDVI